MSNIKKAIALFLSVLFLFCSCINLKQPKNRIEYYTLEYDPPLLKGLDPLPLTIEVERFTVAPVYNTTQIIYSDQSFTRDAYSYHKWRVNPGDLVTYFLTRDMRNSNLFRAVLDNESRLSPSYMVVGTLDEFMEWDRGEKWTALLSLSITLTASNEPDIVKRIIFQKSYNASEECRGKNPKALVMAMSLAMAKVSGKIIRDIHDQLKDRAS